MAIKVINATNLRSNLSEALDDVVASREPTLVRRRSHADVALVSVEMLEELMELHDPEYVKSIQAAREDVKQGNTFSYDEVFGQL